MRVWQILPVKHEDLVFLKEKKIAFSYREPEFASITALPARAPVQICVSEATCFLCIADPALETFLTLQLGERLRYYGDNTPFSEHQINIPGVERTTLSEETWMRNT